MEGGEQQSMMSSDIQEIGGSSSNGGKSSFMCRQSSTRWTPTTEQIRILKELYYNNGVRSPTAEQIQRISAKLRQYGKIEGKNVFYWFQNHKARERQKKRFTADHHQIPTMHRRIIINDPPPHLSPINFSPASPYNINTPSPAGHFPSSSTCSPAFITTHHVGNSYGSIAMEKSFRECSINPSGNVGGQNIAWIGVDPHHHHHQHNPFLENRRYTTNCKSTSTRDFQTLGMAAAEEDEEEEELDQIETLPLFPMHGDLINNDYFSGWHRRRGGGGADDDSSPAAGPMASLELTLNSYAARFSTS